MIKHKTIYMLLFFYSITFCKDKDRIITIGGSVTDIVFELGYGSNVIATDQSSTIPPKVKELPQVGYIRAISAEGVLSMNPTMIITTTDIGPPNVVEQLKKTGVDLYIFDTPYSFRDITMLVKDIANCLNEEKKGIELNNNLLHVNSKVEEIKNKIKKKYNFSFFMNPSIGSFSAAGSRTKADYLIQYIGGQNIFSNDFSKYSKVTKETIIKRNPEIILIGNTMGVDNHQLSTIFTDHKEFKNITAVINDDIFTIDMGTYLTFGSSFPKNTLSLLEKLYDRK